jgi:hypothetical protein
MRICGGFFVLVNSYIRCSPDDILTTESFNHDLDHLIFFPPPLTLLKFVLIETHFQVLSPDVAAS